MSSTHRHSTTGKAVLAGDTDTRLDDHEKRIAALEKAVEALQAPATPIPTPTLPAGAVVLRPGDDVKAACINGATVVLRGGTYSFGFGSTYRWFPNGLTLMAYPGELATIDGTGLDPHFLYLDGGTVTLDGLHLKRFSPSNSGILAVKGGTLRLRSVWIEGDTAKTDTTSHGVYVTANGRAELTHTFIEDIPGAAVQTYNNAGITGTPTAVIDGGSLHARYYPILCWTGSVSAKTALSGSILGDVRQNTGATFTDRGCTGTGPGGAVRVVR
jgi:hypothetical protein